MSSPWWMSSPWCIVCVGIFWVHITTNIQKSYLFKIFKTHIYSKYSKLIFIGIADERAGGSGPQQPTRKSTPVSQQPRAATPGGPRAATPVSQPPAAPSGTPPVVTIPAPPVGDTTYNELSEDDGDGGDTQGAQRLAGKILVTMILVHLKYNGW
jgi:hypothetical protein